MPVNALNTGMYSKLSGGTALTALLGGTFIYHMQPPDDQALPFVVWNWQGGGLTPDHDIISGLEWVRAYGTSAAQAGSVYAAFDALLNGGSLSVTGFVNVGLRREDEFELIENLPNSENVFVNGAYYRIYLDI